MQQLPSRPDQIFSVTIILLPPICWLLTQVCSSPSPVIILDRLADGPSGSDQGEMARFKPYHPGPRDGSTHHPLHGTHHFHGYVKEQPELRKPESVPAWPRHSFNDGGSPTKAGLSHPACGKDLTLAHSVYSVNRKNLCLLARKPGPAHIPSWSDVWRARTGSQT